jgi:hypothetical protein
MITYKVTATGPQGYQVTAISPNWQGALVGDFCTALAAEAFAELMRQIDADRSHASLDGSSA